MKHLLVLYLLVGPKGPHALDLSSTLSSGLVDFCSSTGDEGITYKLLKVDESGHEEMLSLWCVSADYGGWTYLLK